MAPEQCALYAKMNVVISCLNSPRVQNRHFGQDSSCKNSVIQRGDQSSAIQTLEIVVSSLSLRETRSGGPRWNPSARRYPSCRRRGVLSSLLRTFRKSPERNVVITRNAIDGPIDQE